MTGQCAVVVESEKDRARPSEAPVLLTTLSDTQSCTVSGRTAASYAVYMVKGVKCTGKNKTIKQKTKKQTGDLLGHSVSGTRVRQDVIALGPSEDSVKLADSEADIVEGHRL